MARTEVIVELERGMSFSHPRETLLLLFAVTALLAASVLLVLRLQGTDQVRFRSPFAATAVLAILSAVSINRTCDAADHWAAYLAVIVSVHLLAMTIRWRRSRGLIHSVPRAPLVYMLLSSLLAVLLLSSMGRANARSSRPIDAVSEGAVFKEWLRLSQIMQDQRSPFSLEFAQRAARIRPDDLGVRGTICSLRLAFGDVAGAGDACRALLDVDPLNAFGLDVLRSLDLLVGTDRAAAETLATAYVKALVAGNANPFAVFYRSGLREYHGAPDIDGPSAVGSKRRAFRRYTIAAVRRLRLRRDGDAYRVEFEALRRWRNRSGGIWIRYELELAPASGGLAVVREVVSEDA